MLRVDSEDGVGAVPLAPSTAARHPGVPEKALSSADTHRTPSWDGRDERTRSANNTRKKTNYHENSWDGTSEQDAQNDTHKKNYHEKQRTAHTQLGRDERTRRVFRTTPMKKIP